MLRSLRIRDLAIIEDLSVEFESGLGVLTGETGAGKSILVDAVGLAIGERADKSLVRSGTDRALVEALFEVRPNSVAHAWAMDRGLADAGNGELLVRREIAAVGNHRLHINGTPCTLAILRELGAQLLELHGQHAYQTLLSSERHLELLDRLGGHDAALTRVTVAYQAVTSATQHLETLKSQAASREERRLKLQEVVDEINAVAPESGELDELDARRSRLRNASEIRDLLDRLVALTYDGEPSASSLAAAAASKAATLSELDPDVQELNERLATTAVELEDIGAGFRDYRDRANFDPGRLEDLEARRATLERLRLKYGEDEDAVLASRDQAQEQLEELKRIDSDLEGAGAALVEAEQAYVKHARALTRARKSAAKKTVPAVQAQLKALALGKAQLDVDFPPARGPEVGVATGAPVVLSRRGAERAEFLLAANPGEPLKPLAKVASGGELSRIMLALHAVFEEAGEGRALVFDEVDTGISGAVADAVGKRLGNLALRHQVLCVTHLAQVAAYADRHHVVQKQVSDGRTRAQVTALSTEERVEELARMMGAKKTTDAALQHASEMLAAARVRPATTSPRSA